ELELRGLLGCFLFSGDDADKKIKILSGGEKARVALAKVIVSKANFLMLDEPTNHLDMHSCDLLIDALTKYEGSLILVSHDRYFVSKTANKIWEIVEHEIKEFKGGYEEWVAWKERMAKQEAETKKAQGTKDKEQTTKSKGQGTRNKVVEVKKEPVPFQKAPNTAIDKEAKKELQRMQKQFQQLEEHLAKLNLQKIGLEEKLVDPSIYSDRMKFMETEGEIKNVNEELTRLNQQYEQIFEKIVLLES
ncbi:MAG: ATP-binding cassette domain-containing protein, partial [Chitinophagaceae bacterium]